MSTSAFFYDFQRNLLRFGGPVLIGIGTVSTILNLIVFTKDTLRKNPSTICFIATNILNFLSIYVSIIFIVLASGYDIDLSSNDIFICRFRFYVGLVVVNWETSCLILASVNCALITSKNAGTRRLSTDRFAVVSIIGLGLFWTALHVHALIFTDILQYGPSYFVCYYQPGPYTTFMTYYTLLIMEILLPTLMVIFGCWTIKHVRGLGPIPQNIGAGNTSTVVVGRPYAVRSKDRQLIRILLMDITAYIIFKFPVAIYDIYQEITLYEQKSVEQQTVEQYVIQLIYFVFYIPNCIGFYTNIIVSKTFRSELKSLLLNGRRFCFRQRN